MSKTVNNKKQNFNSEIFIVCFHACRDPNELVTLINVLTAAGAILTIISDIRTSIFCCSLSIIMTTSALAGCRIFNEEIDWKWKYFRDLFLLDISLVFLNFSNFECRQNSNCKPLDLSASRRVWCHQQYWSFVIVKPTRRKIVEEKTNKEFRFYIENETIRIGIMLIFEKNNFGIFDNHIDACLDFFDVRWRRCGCYCKNICYLKKNSRWKSVYFCYSMI